MARLSTLQWAQAQATWEADPSLSFNDIAKRFGCSKQAVQKQARTWERSPAPLVERNAKAQVQADRAMQHTIESIKADPEALAQAEQMTRGRTGERVAEVADSLRPAVEAEAITLRAAVLKRHREEVAGPRNLAYQALRGKDAEGRKLSDDQRLFFGRLAKVTMETLRGVHEMERKAWGLDAGVQEGPFVVERY